MRISAVSGGGYLRTSASWTPSPAPSSTFADEVAWGRVLQQADALRARIGDLQRLLVRIRPQGGTTGVAMARSAAAISLDDVESTSSVLRSTERVNATTTTFDPPMPVWAGASTAAPVIGGTYAGTAAETYTIEVREASSAPNRANRLRVYDGAGTVLEQIQVAPSDVGATTFTLSSGLTVRFATGSFVTGDRFEVQAFPPRPSVVDPDDPFDGTGASYPNLQAGFAVTAGSFTVNGTTIAVAANDSITSVLERITDLTDVTASFDPSTQTVVLARDDVGNLPITLADDTSGFLAAVRLAGAVLEPGSIVRSTELPMAQHPSFAGVTAGSITVNGIAIALDPATDSLAAVLERIRSSGAGVTVTLATDDHVTIVGRRAGEDLRLVDGGTGFLAAVGIAEGVSEAPVLRTGDRLSSHSAGRVADALAEVGVLLNALAATTAEGTVLGRAVDGFRGDARRLFATAFGSREAPASLRGLALGADRTDDPRVLDVSTAGKRATVAGLRRSYDEFRTAMTAEIGPGRTNLLEQLDSLAAGLATTARQRMVFTL